MKDIIFSHSTAKKGSFSFTAQEVADVFDDMLVRSIPRYKDLLDLIAQFLVRTLCNYRHEVSWYDIGCSHGALVEAVSCYAMEQKKSLAHVHCTASDMSPAMCEYARKKIMPLQHVFKTVHVLCEAVEDSRISNASALVLNFVLQFLPLQERLPILQKLYDALQKDGILIISEKLRPQSSIVDKAYGEIHDEFKALQGYSAKEIQGKKTALQGILIPISFLQLQEMLLSVGFSDITILHAYGNFTSLVCVK